MLRSKSVRLPSLVLASVLFLAACGGQPPEPAPTAALAPTSAPPTDAAGPAAAVPTAAPSATPTTAVTPTEPPLANPTSDPITGRAGLARGMLKQRPMIVMIDNHPDAYPQTGLDHAAVVVEALAEFGVTRFMAVLAPGITPDAPKIGPVRSTRLYFAQWAMGFHALYAHAGGSPQGLGLVESTDQLVNLDALHKNAGGYFTRSSDRDAPHNLYTSSASLARALEDQGLTSFSDATIGFLFKTDVPAAERAPAQALSYFFLYPQDSVGWTYDPKTNGYYRLRRGKPARDAATGKQLWAKNVVVMEVREAKIADDPKGRIEQTVVGAGAAEAFIDGRPSKITWRKAAPAAALTFFDAADVEVRFNAGPLWISAVPDLAALQVK